MGRQMEDNDISKVVFDLFAKDGILNFESLKAALRSIFEDLSEETILAYLPSRKYKTDFSAFKYIVLAMNVDLESPYLDESKRIEKTFSLITPGPLITEKEIKKQNEELSLDLDATKQRALLLEFSRRTDGRMDFED